MNFGHGVRELLEMDGIETAGIGGRMMCCPARMERCAGAWPGFSFMYKCAGAMAARMGTLEEVLEAPKKQKTIQGPLVLP